MAKVRIGDLISKDGDTAKVKAGSLIKKKDFTSPLAPLPEGPPQAFGPGSENPLYKAPDQKPVNGGFDFKELDKFKNSKDQINPADEGDPFKEAAFMQEQAKKETKTYDLAVKADKEGRKTFTDVNGKEQLTGQHIEQQNAVENFSSNLYNGLLELPKGAATLYKLQLDYTPSGYLLNKASELVTGEKLSAKAEEARQGIEESKANIPQDSQKNIIDNPSDPLAYSALSGQLLGYVIPSLLTGGVGNAANLTDKGLKGAQILTSFTQAASMSYQNSKDSGLSDNGSAAMTLVTAPVITALELVGMGKMVNNGLTQKLIQRTGFEAIQEATDGFTKKFTPKILQKAADILSKKTPDIIKRVGGTAGTEGVTEVLQEGYEMSAQAAYNSYFKDKDEKGFNVDDWQKRLLIAGASGAAGGGFFGLTPRAKELSVKKDQLTNDLNKEDTPDSVRAVIQSELDKVNEELAIETQNQQQETEDFNAKQSAIEELKAKKSEIDSQIQREDLSPETKLVLENQNQEIDNQLKELQNEEATQASEKGVAQESTETPAVQEGQQLEEKLVDGNKASVPVMITNKMRSELDGLGYSKEEISNLTPVQAHKIIQNGEINPATDSGAKPEVTIPEQKVSDSEGNSGKVDKKVSKHQIKKEEDAKRKEIRSRDRTSPNMLARGYFMDGGTVLWEQSENDKKTNKNQSSVVRETGLTSADKKTHPFRFTKDGPSIEAIAHKLYEQTPENLRDKFDEQDIRNAIIDVLHEDPKSWHDIQDKESAISDDDELNFHLSNLSEEERVEYNNWEESEESGVLFEKEKANLAKQYDEYIKSDEYKDYINQQTNDRRSESSQNAEDKQSQGNNGEKGAKRKTADVIRENGDKAKGQVQEIKEKQLTHVAGLGMGQNQAKGTYLSTEDKNRYVGRGGKEFTAEADISNPYTTNLDAFAEIQRAAIAQHFPGKEIIEDLSESEIETLAGILTDTFIAEGYDSIYFPESDTQEGELIVFDKDNVKLNEVPPVPPVENAEAESKAPEKKKRKFPKQLMEDPDLSNEVKKGLAEDTVNYIPITNKITNHEANVIIQEKGLDQALEDVRDTKNGMKAPVRIALAENIIKQSNKAASEATNQEERNKHLDRAIKTADFISEYLTELGQGVQAASMYAKLSPEGVLRYVKREYDRTRKKAIAEVSDELKDNKEAIDKINKDAIEKVLGTDKVKKAIQGKVKNVSDTRKKTVKKATDFLEKLKVNTKGKTNDITHALPATVWNVAIETIQKSLELGLSVVESIDAAVKYVKSVHKEEWDEKGFRKQFSGDLSKYEAAIDPAGSTKKGIADLGINIQEIVKEHYSKVDTAKKTLVQKILDNTDLSEIDAKEIAKNIEEEFDRITTAEKKKALIKGLSAKSIIPSKKPQFYEAIIKLSNTGALSEADWHKLYAHKMGLPSLSDADAKKLMDLADKAQTAKDGFQKNRATQDLLAFQEKLKGINWGEVGSAIWYANILSGLSTQTTNGYSGFMEVLGELWVASVQDPKKFPLLASQLYDGWGRGLLEAQSILKTGYQAEKGPKIDSPGTLERIKFTPGKYEKWNPLNYSKYVSRLMSAVDIFHYHALKEMRAGELAMKMAVLEGKDKPTQSIKTRAIEILNKTKEREAQARTQAIEEGLKGQELDRRVFELMEQSRPAKLTEDAADFAAHGTFNYEPEGLLGALTAGFNYVSSLAEIKGVRPLQFIVPFTRVIANVTNRSLDWSPWGLVRGAKGGIGYENKLTKDRFIKKYTPEERQKEYIKAVTGTLAMAALWAMSDDEDGLFEITADGTGDRKKNYELQGTGWRPYSIKVGDTWMEYKNTPLSIPFAMVGFARDAMKYKGEKDIEAKFSIAALGGAKYIMDMNFLSSLAGFFSVFSKDNPDADASFTQRAQKELGRTAKGFIIPNLFTQASRTIQEIYDLPMKRANGIMEEFTRDIPVLRNNQENLYNALGDPVVADQTRKFVPFKPKNDEDDKVWDLIIDNKAWIGLPSKETEFYDKKMKAERTFDNSEYNEFARLSGQYTKKAIQDHYDDLKSKDSKEEVKKAIEKLKKKAREKAKRDMSKKINK